LADILLPRVGIKRDIRIPWSKRLRIYTVDFFDAPLLNEPAEVPTD